jgi:hypothetical protein
MERKPAAYGNAFFALALLLSVAGCHGSGGGNSGGISSSFAPPTLTLPGGGTTITLVLGQTANFTVSEPETGGTYGAVSSDRTVVTVTPPGLAASSRSPQGSGTFLLTAVGIGSATVAVVDSLGSHVQFGVNVVAPTPGTPVPSAGTVSFTLVGQTQTITVTQSGYSGTFTAASQNPSVATVSGSGPFTITAVAAGTTTIAFTNAQAITASVTVIVTITGGVIF